MEKSKKPLQVRTPSKEEEQYKMQDEFNEGKQEDNNENEDLQHAAEKYKVTDKRNESNGDAEDQLRK